MLRAGGSPQERQDIPRLHTGRMATPDSPCSETWSLLVVSAVLVHQTL